MSDRELLELAAKAAGINGFGLDAGMGKYGFYTRHMFKSWNPLTDDGDALRLAVKLGLEVGICLDMPLGDYSFSRLGDGRCVMENHQNQPGAATRRAITRAAAEIGKAMAD